MVSMFQLIQKTLDKVLNKPGNQTANNFLFLSYGDVLIII